MKVEIDAGGRRVAVDTDENAQEIALELWKKTAEAEQSSPGFGFQVLPSLWQRGDFYVRHLGENTQPTVR